jgi:hypothetical protein
VEAGGGSGRSGAQGVAMLGARAMDLYMQRDHTSLGTSGQTWGGLVGVRPDDGGLPGDPKQGWAAAAQGVARGGAGHSRRLGVGAALERREGTLGTRPAGPDAEAAATGLWRCTLQTNPVRARFSPKT